MLLRPCPTRRQVMRGLAASYAVGCVGEDVVGPADRLCFPRGVQVGDPTHDSVVVSTRSCAHAVIFEVVGMGTTSAIPTVDGWAHTVIEGLQAGQAVEIVAWTEDRRRSEPTRARTAPAPGTTSQLRFGAVSCLGDEDPTWPSLTALADPSLDALWLLGDTVYADHADQLEDYRAVWDQVFATPSARAALSSSALVATWDDHEVDDNWYLDSVPVPPRGTPVSARRLACAAQAFTEAMPRRAGPLHRTLRWGDTLELVVLDLRGERDGQRLLSEAQLAWAVEQIRSSDAVFKVLLSSVDVADHAALFGFTSVDRWSGHPTQRAAMVQALVDTPGAMVVTGDLHYGGVHRLDPSGGPADGVWEVAVGPVGSRIWPLIPQLEPDDQHPLLLTERTSSTLAFDPETGEVCVQFWGADSIARATRTLQVA